jgi:hypothetical protein
MWREGESVAELLMTVSSKTSPFGAVNPVRSIRVIWQCRSFVQSKTGVSRRHR